MKVSYYDIFDMIAGESGELLACYENQPLSEREYTAEETIQNVRKKIGNRKVKHTKKIRLGLLIAAVFILSFSLIAFSIQRSDILKDGAALVDEENKDLIGSALVSQEATVVDRNGNAVSGSVPEETDGKQAINESTIIHSVEDESILPNTISYFAVHGNENGYITPEIIFGNGAMVVLTQENGSGWELKRGERLIFETELYPSEVTNGKGQNIWYGYVCNGKLVMDDHTDEELSLYAKYELEAAEDGEYYICFVGASSDPITLKEGKVYQTGK